MVYAPWHSLKPKMKSWKNRDRLMGIMSRSTQKLASCCASSRTERGCCGEQASHRGSAGSAAREDRFSIHHCDPLRHSPLADRKRRYVSRCPVLPEKLRAEICSISPSLFPIQSDAYIDQVKLPLPGAMGGLFSAPRISHHGETCRSSATQPERPWAPTKLSGGIVPPRRPLDRALDLEAQRCTP